jgi:MFS family permease
VVVEWRAREPIIPLSLWRSRTYATAVVSTFLISFGFFGAVIFLPRWFQVVGGASATQSGYSLMPLIFALIISATGSGQIVARTGRYKMIIFAAMVSLAVGLFLLTNLRADTPLPVVFLWMVIAGLGIGPSFAIFSVVVQNTVQPRFIGIATASLTFFQQIGGTIGLTLAGTVLADRLAAELPARLQAAGVPPQFASGLQGGSSLSLTGTGDLGARILESVPAQFRAIVEPLIPGIVQAIHDSFSIAIASTFWIGIVAAAKAAHAVVLLKEVPMREMSEMGAPATFG